VPTALIDTNIHIATCSSRRVLQFPLLLAWLIGEPLLTEFLEVAARPEHRARIRAGVPQHIEHRLRLGTRWVNPLSLSECPPGRDPNNAIVIVTALAELANFIVTLDKAMLDDDALKTALSAQGVNVVSPAEFLTAIR
jgi:predicted nucleic acid-binding protein